MHPAHPLLPSLPCPGLVLGSSLTSKVMGRPVVAYISTETPNVLYLNLHVAIDQRRFDAEKEDKLGPRVTGSGTHEVGMELRLIVNVTYVTYCID